MQGCIWHVTCWVENCSPVFVRKARRPRHEAVNHRLISRRRAAHSAPGRSDKSTSTRAPPQSDIRAVTRSIIQQSAITKPFLGFAASSTLVFLISSASVLTSCRKLKLKTARLPRSPHGRPNRPRALRDEEAHWEGIYMNLGDALSIQAKSG